ncbi:sugar 3,4-ketoisomerase [Vibrio coralliilyticus]|uniref:sugar 3,4-ketoisomerase n=1 Tax=Vibrio coralliilyticus TaxID=190893 RepID=UPI00148B5C7E|nr:FdtA/QdtA family cupin domain-containing protein [Vibrio coralliilyticus]NOI30710.1 WxcM-like domain-containing protein [Vibrio coralliilyticus]NOI49742.1 WxcM-like domain-containing protein [Vibrio coralliilyticus]
MNNLCPLDRVKNIELPSVFDKRGNLAFAESEREIPFEIKRIYYLYDVPESAERGGHAHKALHQLIIPLSGSFDLHLDDGFSKKTIHMSKSNQAIYICPMIWRTIDNFSKNSVCLVLASDYYSEEDYYRDYKEFINDIEVCNG